MVGSSRDRRPLRQSLRGSFVGLSMIPGMEIVLVVGFKRFSITREHVFYIDIIKIGSIFYIQETGQSRYPRV